MPFGRVEELAPVVEGTVIPKGMAKYKISAEYKYKQPTAPGGKQVGPARDIREHILLCSLYPNIYNQALTYAKKETGTMRANGFS